MNRSLCRLVISLTLLSPAPAWAAQEAPLDSRITHATVFPDRALVTRAATATLARGDTTLLVTGLPANLLPASLRVVAEAEGGVTIGSVESRRSHLAELVREREKRLTDEITTLEDRMRAFDDQTKAHTLQLNFIEAIGKEMPKHAGAELVRGDIKPDSWRQGWETLGSGATRLMEGMRRIEQDKRELLQQLSQKRRELSDIRSGQREASTVQINLTAAAAGKIRLTVSYQVPGARWAPAYDARLDSDSGRVVLTQWGRVQQNTGEDWNDVQLTLSTARPAEATQPPELEPWFIDFYRPQPRAEMLRKSIALEADTAMAPAAAAPAPYQTAEVVTSEFNAEYHIGTRATVPADNAQHRFAIGEQALISQLTLTSVPKLAPAAYLQAQLKYEGPAPLPGGEASLFRDGVYVGNGALPQLNPGGEATLAFGADDKVHIDYRLDGDVRSTSGLIDKQKRVERRYHVEVTNHHSRPMAINLQDQLPVARDERIKVEWLKGLDSPTAVDVEGRSGVASWAFTAAPQEKRVLRFGYGVSYPRELQVPEFE